MIARTHTLPLTKHIPRQEEREIGIKQNNNSQSRGGNIEYSVGEDEEQITQGIVGIDS